MRTVLLALAVAAPLAAQQPQDRGWRLDPDGDVRLTNYNGTVTLVGWDRDSVALTAVVAGNAAVFGGGTPRGVKAGLEVSGVASQPVADFTVRVPARARVAIRGGATTVDVRAFAGALDVTTLDGRVRVAGAPTEITVETMGGDVDLEGSPAYLRVRTAGGRITWSGSSDDVSLTSVTGAITVPSGTLFRARLESISGDVRFSGSVKPEGRVTVDSHSGAIALVFADQASAMLTVDAPSATVLSREYARRPGMSPPVVTVQPPGGAMKRPAEVLVRTFKGRVTVTRP